MPDKTTNWRVWGCCGSKGNLLFKTVNDEASIKRGRPKLAASFILGQTCDVACWDETD